MVQPNFRGNFKDLSPARSRELDRFSTSGKSEILDLAEIDGEHLLSYPEIAARVKRSHEWVRRKVSSLGLKPLKIYRGKNYFSEGVVDTLKRAASKR